MRRSVSRAGQRLDEMREEEDAQITGVAVPAAERESRSQARRPRAAPGHAQDKCREEGPAGCQLTTPAFPQGGLG